MVDQHILTLTERADSPNSDGICSCAKWRVKNRPKSDIRERHAEHLQEYLGPEAQERRLEGKMKEIYVVMGACGEYSDHEEWPVFAYPDEALAKQHVERAAAAYRELLQLTESPTGPSRYSLGAPPYQNVYDKDMRTDYTGTDYYYITVPFAESLDVPPFAEAPL